MNTRANGESPNDLSEMDSDEDFTFPPAERRVITQPVDLSVTTLFDQWESGLLSLPEIQREYVWDNGKASRLAESLLLNIPIPVLYFSETQDAKYEIIDGHQRVQSIARFLRNEFALSGLGVLREYKGLRYHQLPAREQRFFQMRTLRVVIISADSHPNMKFEIFERLNTGAISLNAQELRNSIYRGSINDMLHKLVKEPTFRQLMGSKVPRKRMVDEELVLRFFALREDIPTYRTPLKRFLNNYMEGCQQLAAPMIADMTSLFKETVATVSTIFGPLAFRNLSPDGTVQEPSVNRALFDAQMLASSWVNELPTSRVVARARARLAGNFGDEEFLDSIQRATGDRSRTLRRLRFTAEALAGAGIAIHVPFSLTQ